MRILNGVCSLCLVHGVFVAAHLQHEVEVDDESQLMEVQLLQLSRKVGKKPLESSAPEPEKDPMALLVQDQAASVAMAESFSQPLCAIGDAVMCPDGVAMCAGDQCCPDGSACPSSSDDFNGCPAPRAHDCSGASPPSPPPASDGSRRRQAHHQQRRRQASPSPPSPPLHHQRRRQAVAPPAPPAAAGGGASASQCGDDASCIVAELNALYMGFDEGDRNSPLGVTLRMATHDDFKLHCGSGCFNGYSDCKMSAALYNHRVMRSIDGQITVAMERHSGIIFHQAAVETTVAKCYFQYDGATYFRVNRGCGCSGNNNCDDPDGAFLNTATAGDDRVDRCSCDSLQQRQGSLPGWQQELCFWRGPAYDTTGATTDNQMFEMLRHRISTQNSQNSEESHENWNEVVLDAAVMQESLASDPNSVVQAFFYVRGTHGSGHAHSMSDRFAAEYGARIPVIELDPAGVMYGAGAPFRVER